MKLGGPWPNDARLDPFRSAVWEMSLDGRVEAYLTSEVWEMRSLPLFWVKREWLWYQLNWVDGRRDRPDEDYGPEWYTVAELAHGTFEQEAAGVVIKFDARPVTGADRDKLWERYGPPA